VKLLASRPHSAFHIRLEGENTKMAKRKNRAPSNGQPKKKRAISDDEAHKNFRSGLFDGEVLEGYTKYYAESQP
jgi:hypothetical protein